MLLSDCGGDALKGESQDLQCRHVLTGCTFPLHFSWIPSPQAS